MIRIKNFGRLCVVFVLALALSLVLANALDFTPKANVDLQNRYSIQNMSSLQDSQYVQQNNGVDLIEKVATYGNSKPIELPVGTYAVNSSGLILQTGTNIKGHSEQDTIIDCSAVPLGTSCVRAPSGTRIYQVHLEGITFTGNDNQTCLDVTNISQASYKDLHFSNCDIGLRGAGSNYYNDYFSLGFSNNNENLHFQNSSNENHFFGGQFASASRDNIVLETGTNQVVFFGSSIEGANQTIRMNGNGVRSIGFYGVRFEVTGTSNLTFGSGSWGSSCWGGYTSGLDIYDLGTGNQIMCADNIYRINHRQNANGIIGNMPYMIMNVSGNGQTDNSSVLELIQSYANSGNPAGLTIRLARSQGKAIRYASTNDQTNYFWVAGNGDVFTAGDLDVNGTYMRLNGLDVCLEDGTNCAISSDSTVVRTNQVNNITVSANAVAGRPYFMVNVTGSGQDNSTPVLYLANSYSNSGSPSLIRGEIARVGGDAIRIHQQQFPRDVFVVTARGATQINALAGSGLYPVLSVNISSDSSTNDDSPFFQIRDDYSAGGSPTAMRIDLNRSGGYFQNFFYLGAKKFSVSTLNGNVYAAGTFSGSMQWDNLTSYPSACPAGTYITTLGDTVTCASVSNAVNLTISSLTGSGNDFLCIDSTGKLYRDDVACT